MKRSNMVLVAFTFSAIVGCGGAAATEANAPKNNEPPREPITAEAMRERWAKLGDEETEVVRAVDEMGGLPADARMQRLQRARDSAGFIVGGLRAFAPPAEHAKCHADALEAANELKGALDGINAVWLGQSSGDRRSEAQRLAGAICLGEAKLARARVACGVLARVPTSSACAGQ